MSDSFQSDGAYCPGCGLANWHGLCPHCSGDQDRYERELVPPFESSLPVRDEPDASGSVGSRLFSGGKEE